MNAETVLARIAAHPQRDVAIAAMVRRAGEAEVAEFTDALEMFDRSRGRSDGIGTTLHEAGRARIAVVTPKIAEQVACLREVVAKASDDDVRTAAMTRLAELSQMLELLGQAQMVAVL